MRSVCVLLMFQNRELRFMSFLVDGDLADRCRCFWMWVVGVQDETKHLLGPRDPSQAPVNYISKWRKRSLFIATLRSFVFVFVFVFPF